MLSRNPFSQPAAGSSFLPEDILQKRAERRTSAICLTLFFITMFCVAGAFFVTNQRWSSVKEQQRRINSRYMQAAKDIEQLRAYEEQESAQKGRAALISALIERVPRSILMAELVNRMPENTTLLEMTLKSKRDSKPVAAPKPRDAKKAVSLARGRAAQKNDEPDTPPEPQAPKFSTALTLIGAAASHTEVSHYLASLQMCPLLHLVELKFSEATIINDQGFIKFRIEAEIRPEADARRIEPLRTPRLRSLVGPGEQAEDESLGDTLKSLWGGKKEK